MRAPRRPMRDADCSAERAVSTFSFVLSVSSRPSLSSFERGLTIVTCQSAVRNTTAITVPATITDVAMPSGHGKQFWPTWKYRAAVQLEAVQLVSHEAQPRPVEPMTQLPPTQRLRSLLIP